MGASASTLIHRFLAAAVDDEWRTRSACRWVDAELFFATGKWGSASEQPREQAAKQVCSRCPVRLECLLDAEAAGDAHAIRGGLTPIERARARADRGAA